MRGLWKRSTWIEEIGSGFGHRLVAPPVHALTLAPAEETFGRGIVAAMAWEKSGQTAIFNIRAFCVE